MLGSGSELVALRSEASWKSRYKRHLVVAWMIVVPLLVVFALLSRRAELERAAAMIGEADPRWFLLGVGIEVLTLYAAAQSYRVLLGRLGYQLSWLSLASAHLQRGAIGAVSPLSGPTSVCVVLHLLARLRVPAHDALLAIGLRSVAGQVAFVLTMIVALALLQPIAALGLLGALLIAAAVWPVLARWSPIYPAHRAARFGERHLPRTLLTWIAELIARFRRHRLSPGDVSLPAALAIACRAGSIALLFVSLRAIGVDASLGAAILVYFAALVAHATLPMFGGAGFVEGAATAALIKTGVPADLALAAALLWRLIDHWLPLAVGLIAHFGVLLGPRVTPPARAASNRLPRRLPINPRPAALVAEPIAVASTRRVSEVGRFGP